MRVVLDPPGDLAAPAEGFPSTLDPYLPLLGRLQQAPPISETASRLVERALEIWSRPGFDTLISLPRLRFEPFDYQLRAAEAVLRRMRGRAILADEVGLGKTIEACLVLAELRLRALAARILILVPPGLVDQWREELERKFGLPSHVVAGGGWEPARRNDNPVLIASLASARRPPLRDALAATRWDLLIVDEAHRLKNPRSASARLVRSLSARYLLLLTATPVENRLGDLFQLANLASPGLLGSQREFRAQHGAAGAEKPRNLVILRSRMGEVMVRHRRSEVALMLPRRLAQTICITPGPEEADLYRAVSERVRKQGRDASPSRLLGLLAVQRLAGSSPAVLEPLLTRVGWPDLAERAATLGASEKTRVLIDLLLRHQARSEKVIVFTAFRQSLDYLAELAARSGLRTTLYHGSLTRQAKERAIRSFRDDVAILLTTEAAGEGRNLQFCHVMINFDLPWNPMQIEQRLGRIHRIGQDTDVMLFNLVAKGTVEERILSVLEAKINLFELVVGELDMILGRVEDDFDFESSVFRAHVHAADDHDLWARLEALGDDLTGAHRGYLASRERTDLLVDDPAEDGR